MEKVTVAAAIKKGWMQLSVIPLLSMGVTITVSVLLVAIFKAGSDLVGFWLFCCFLLPVAIGLVYHQTMLPRWRIWAFSNVRNVHELKRLALLSHIYPKDSSFLWRLEITSAGQKEALKALEQKFQEPDVFEDDPAIPDQTAYAYPKSHKVFFLLFAVAAIVFGVFLLGKGERTVQALFIVAGGILSSVAAYNRFANSQPLLTLSNEGITTQKDGFHSWGEIQNERVFWVRAGKSSYYELSYEAGDKRIMMSLRELLGRRAYFVAHLLFLYKGRYDAKQRRMPAK